MRLNIREALKDLFQSLVGRLQMKKRWAWRTLRLVNPEVAEIEMFLNKARKVFANLSDEDQLREADEVFKLAQRVSEVLDNQPLFRCVLALTWLFVYQIKVQQQQAKGPTKPQ